MVMLYQVEDGGSPTRFCTGDVIIEILDENDNCPMFNNLVTTYNIREDLSGDDEVGYNNNICMLYIFCSDYTIGSNRYRCR